MYSQLHTLTPLYPEKEPQERKMIGPQAIWTWWWRRRS